MCILCKKAAGSFRSWAFNADCFGGRWCFDVELVYLCKRLQIPVSEVSVNWAEIPGSKVRIYSFVHMLLELVLVRLGYGFRIWKIHTNFTQD